MSKTLPISEFTSKIGSGATPKGGKEAYLGGEYTLIRSQNVHDFFFSDRTDRKSSFTAVGRRPRVL